MSASNTKECFRDVVGKHIVGVMFDACPPTRLDIASGTKTLVFDDGTGLTIASNGAFWLESRDIIAQARDQRKAELDRIGRDLRDILALSGE